MDFCKDFNAKTATFKVGSSRICSKGCFLQCLVVQTAAHLRRQPISLLDECCCCRMTCLCQLSLQHSPTRHSRT
jgi:hypothetical protein